MFHTRRGKKVYKYLLSINVPIYNIERDKFLSHSSRVYHHIDFQFRISKTCNQTVSCMAHRGPLNFCAAPERQEDLRQGPGSQAYALWHSKH